MTEPDLDRVRDDLALIRQMVDQSRQVRAETGHIYLIIGVLFMIAGIVDTVLPPERGWIAWPAAGVLAMFTSIVEGRRTAARRGHVGFAPPIEGVAWMTAGTVLGFYVFLSISIEGHIPVLMFPFIALVISIPLAVSGALYRYWPLGAGAAVFLLLGVVSAFLGDTAQRLGFSLAMLLGYVAPGLGMMRANTD